MERSRFVSRVLSLTIAGVIGMSAMAADGRAAAIGKIDQTTVVEAGRDSKHQQQRWLLDGGRASGSERQEGVSEQALERCRVGPCFDTTVSVDLRVAPPWQAQRIFGVALRDSWRP